MFLKQYNYKPRQGSQSSGSDTAERTNTAMQNAAQAEAAKQQSSNPGAAGRRRSSDVKFSGLSGYKRSSMDDKRTSYADQDRNAGVLGQMWNNFTKGTGNQGTGNK